MAGSLFRRSMLILVLIILFKAQESHTGPIEIEFTDVIDVCMMQSSKPTRKLDSAALGVLIVLSLIVINAFKS
jgi:hypothetical protein